MKVRVMEAVRVMLKEMEMAKVKVTVAPGIKLMSWSLLSRSKVHIRGRNKANDMRIKGLRAGGTV